MCKQQWDVFICNIGGKVWYREFITFIIIDLEGGDSFLEELEMLSNGDIEGGIAFFQGCFV